MYAQGSWLIEDQINGDPTLNYDPARGPVTAPWLSWGPYFWTYGDGTSREYDGFTLTTMPVLALNSGRMWPNRPESCVDVVEATLPGPCADLGGDHLHPPTAAAPSTLISS